jgi:hypothetical protein
MPGEVVVVFLLVNVMNNHTIGDKINRPAGLPATQAPINILTVHEHAFVQTADAGQAFPSNKYCRPKEPVNRTDLVMILVGHLVAAGKLAAPSQKPEWRTPHQKRSQGRKTSRGKLNPAVGMDQFRPTSTDLGIGIHELDHVVDGAGSGFGIWIQHKAVTRWRIEYDLVVIGGKTHDLVVDDQADLREVLGQHLGDFWLADIIDQHHFQPSIVRVGEHTIQVSTQEREVAVADNADGHISFAGRTGLRFGSVLGCRCTHLFILTDDLLIKPKRGLSRLIP